MFQHNRVWRCRFLYQQPKWLIWKYVRASTHTKESGGVVPACQSQSTQPVWSHDYGTLSAVHHKTLTHVNHCRSTHSRGRKYPSDPDQSGLAFSPRHEGWLSPEEKNCVEDKAHYRTASYWLPKQLISTCRFGLGSEPSIIIIRLRTWFGNLCKIIKRNWKMLLKINANKS